MKTDTQKYFDFWEPKSLADARRLILDTPEWESMTAKTLTDIFTPKVERHLKQFRTLERCLEIGGGIGRLLKPISTKFKEAIGIDISQGMVDLSKDYLEGVDNAKVVKCDGITFPIEGNSVELVYSVICFQHIPYRLLIQKYLRETRRVLKDGGICRIQTHRGIGLGKFSDWVGFWYEDIGQFSLEFSEAGLRVIEMQTWGDYLWVTAAKNDNNNARVV